eukprot:c25353_g5_i1 orf=498-3425(-)
MEPVCQKSEGEIESSDLQYENEVSSKQVSHAEYRPSVGHVDEGMDNAWSRGGPLSPTLDIQTPNRNYRLGRESRAPAWASKDCIDAKPMKIGGLEVRRLPYKGSELFSSLKQAIEPKNSFLVGRESQSQALSPRRKYKSSNASHEEKFGADFESPTTRSRAAPSQNRALQADAAQVQEEDLYAKQGMLHSRNQPPFKFSAHQKVPQSEEEELYPVSTFMMNDGIAFPQQQGYAGNFFGYQNDVEAYRAALTRAMKESLSNSISSSQISFAKANNTQSHDIGADGNFAYQPNYSSHYFAGPHDHPHDRFQFHSNEQFPVNSYWSSSDRAHALPMDCNQFTWPPLASQNDMPLNSATTACTYKEHAYMQPPSHMPSCLRPHLCASTFGQHSPPMAHQHFQTQSHYLGHQHFQTQAQYLQHTTCGKGVRKLSQSGLHKLQLQREAGSISQFHSACLARKENCPPLPGPGAPPYVLCQGCDKILQVPANLYNDSAVQRIRCGACRRASKFCVVLHPHYQAILKKGITTGIPQRAYGSHSSNEHWLHSTAARMDGLSETSSLYDALQVPMLAKLDRSLGSSCVLGGRHDGVDMQMVTCVVSDDAEKVDALCHYRPPKTMLLEQGPCKSEWRYVNSYKPLSSSGTVHQDHPSSLPYTVCGSSPATRQWSHGLQKVETGVDFARQRAMLGEGKEVLKAPIFADDSIREPSDTRVRVSSGEIQGLTLECLQESSCDVSPLKDHMDSRNLQQGHGQGVSINGVCPASCSPDPGSSLYEHHTYGAGSDIVEWDCKSENKGKQAGGEPCVQDVNKGSNFLAGLLKKNIRELGRGGQGSKDNLKSAVMVNGQIIPHAAIKSAEKQAGTIRPGVYWYDYQAGFWGVVGGPCLGIIPPFIAEFNLLLAKDCAGGTTGVCVNGRELHQKDLDVLAGRGLPRTPGKSYMVDISGQVVDKASGQLLRSLGRLAPTVQRRGRGCGMFQPPTHS